MTMSKTTNINEVLKELKAEVEKLQDEAKAYMTEQGIDEVITDDGIKATYREVLSNRFASTEFKKVHEDLYKAFTKQTSSMRFTLN